MIAKFFILCCLSFISLSASTASEHTESEHHHHSSVPKRAPSSHPNFSPSAHPNPNPSPDTPLYNECSSHFQKFLNKHHRGGKFLSASELTKRNAIFCDAMLRSDQNNKLNGNPVFGVTKFSDRTKEELASLFGVIAPKIPSPTAAPIATKKLRSTRTLSGNVNIFDWRDYIGVVSPVKNQGQCGSCWAHSVASTIESAWAIAGNGLLEFSPQHIVSCVTSANGCGGGNTIAAYEYLTSFTKQFKVGLLPVRLVLILFHFIYYCTY